MDIITTPSAPDANSYLTVDEANQILTERQLYSAKWEAADTATRTRALIYATRLLDVYFDWQGVITVSQSQALAWPRAGVIDREYRLVPQFTIPDRIKQATAELARFILTRDRTAEPTAWSLGFSEIRVGPIDLRIDRRRDQSVNMIPDSVIALLADLGAVANNLQTGRTKIVKLLRG